MTSVQVILSHEYRRFQCYRHEHSPYHRMFFAVFCNIEERLCLFRTWSFTLFENDLDSTGNSDSVSSFPMINCCGLISLWRITTNRLSRSVIHRFVSFPLLRKPRSVIIPPWVACWVHVAVDNGLSRSIIFLSFRTPGTLTSMDFLPWAFWRRRWQSWGSLCNKTHHQPRLCCDSFFSRILL